MVFMDMAPGPSKTVLLFLIIATVVSFSVAQHPTNLGRKNCLMDRQEYFPCTLKFPLTTKVPGKGESGTYRIGFNRRQCKILKKTHQIEAIPVINAATDPVFVVSSPGFYQTPPQNYGRNQLVYYNISCKKGQYVFFNMTNFHLERANCRDPQDDNINKCVDYVQVRLGNDLLVGENCGNDTTGVYEQIFPFDSFKLMFHSNRKDLFPGFSATALCFEPGLTYSDEGMARKKRCLTSLSPGEYNLSKCIEVPYGVDVIYMNHTLDFVVRETGRIMIEKRLENVTIDVLITFSMSDLHGVFISMISKYMQGPGVLFLYNDRAYFERFLVNITALIPTARELQLLSRLNEAIQMLVRQTLADQEKNFTTEGLTSVPTQYLTSDPRNSGFGVPELFSLRCSERDPQVYKMDVLSDEVLILSIQNKMATNPILRVAATALINELEINNPNRLTRLEFFIAWRTPDLNPCTFYRLHQHNRDASVGEFIEYRTKRKGCIIVRCSAIKQDVITIGNFEDGKSQFLYSPNILENRHYKSRQAVIYNVSCPENQAAYFQLLELDLEPNSNSDFLKVFTTSGVIEITGNDISTSGTPIVAYITHLLFRSDNDSSVKRRGFRAILQCFNLNRTENGCDRRRHSQSSFLYIPQEEERKDFNKLLKASFAVVILGSNLETDCPNTLPSFNSDDLRLALRYENSLSSAVLRATVKAILSHTEQYQPQRLMELRNTTTNPPMTDYRDVNIVPRMCLSINLICMCSTIGYSKFYLPNFREHSNATLVNSELSNFMPIFNSPCSSLIKHLICSVYAPSCIDQQRLFPCYKMCKHVRDNCINVIFSWPTVLNCDNAEIFKNDSRAYCPPIPTEYPSPE